MIKRIAAVIAAVFIAVVPRQALAHCPLCTAGAGVAAVAAVYLGVNPPTVGLFIGAFAAALGLWIGRLVKRSYFPHQTKAIAAFSWVTTVFPLARLIPDYSSVYLTLAGDYGSLLNRTYVYNRFTLGGLLGGLLVLLAPATSRALTRIRGKNFPFQGMILTLGLLLAAAAMIELSI
ncbi:hypothetical protein A3F28_03060 [Candidatus Uhrbacteria bacterium RIFCSPHIGHO2_12_FULL_57_11]|uniref:Uncharacterized protein n=1 Tax=Candidatus Uhrbacteria bacterium RIFCSPHIGHO2_12_FULL_57_11 TaxID=1802398 RepID=A0A1F7UJY3_9BACT|nr:MAG: hypothetical protein A3F28_03060 [Candidatus Uhrbacteria bacterium RIFCSPHIGHO2_12_FULL_57_11]